MDEGSLYYAVVENEAEKLESLLEQGGNVNEFYEDTMNISTKSLLHVCCGKGHVECLKVLINHGAQLTVRDKWGQTPLMYSVSIQFPEIAKILLEADPELVLCQDRYGKSSLHLAVDTGNEEIVRLLLEHGADANVRCHEGLTPLMYCCTPDTDGMRVGVLKLLLESGAAIALKDHRGKRSALHIAVISGNVVAVEILIGAGADVNEIDKTLRTPLTHAISYGVRGPVVNEVFMRIIMLLVSAGAELNVRVSESCNPLLTSALLKSDTLVKYFLSLGADCNIKFSSGVTPSLVCASNGDLATLKPLIYHNCDLTIKGNVYKRKWRLEFILDTFELAYMEGYLDLCTLMIRSGYPVSTLRHIFARDLAETEENTAVQLDFMDHPHLTLCNSARLPPDFRETLKWFLEVASNPRSLRDEAVRVIRLCLGQRLILGIETLPLPSFVKSYILFNHLLLN
ncbi:serine/threonine-protein phosphatase 6 regulatory ankyrin repeat subunit A [Biomphalaria pfeifferi]|uniref:Serine/threonine-protein phosphatase 6 regulatory ankyrin repeat subunit A n=1 Tax=Biomphalaria pfeifferi TaxID=112525 RepID=A0AAD8F2N0_BIOPF|nr:serine/threonine-protein phosphatase 6 regulatory ankyrin repeat subunit A [Biomphalaria pfeifferi]